MNAPFDFRALAARARADNPDAELLDLIEEDKSFFHRLDQALQAAKGDSRATRKELRRAAADGYWANRERLAARRPATLEGLLAKLRHAIGKDRPAPAYALEQAALRDALAYLDPPEPKPRRAAR